MSDGTNTSDEGALSVHIDWEGSKVAWIDEARAAWESRLLNDSRFPDARKAIARFNRAVDAWNANRTNSFRDVINIGNELAAAKALLGRLESTDTLRYELPIAGSRHTIDFVREVGST